MEFDGGGRARANSFLVKQFVSVSNKKSERIFVSAKLVSGFFRCFLLLQEDDEIFLKQFVDISGFLMVFIIAD